MFLRNVYPLQYIGRHALVYVQQFGHSGEQYHICNNGGLTATQNSTADAIGHYLICDNIDGSRDFMSGDETFAKLFHIPVQGGLCGHACLSAIAQSVGNAYAFEEVSVSESDLQGMASQVIPTQDWKGS